MSVQIKPILNVCKYLGKKIDNKLMWKDHLSQVNSIIYKCIGILYKA